MFLLIVNTYALKKYLSTHSMTLILIINYRQYNIIGRYYI